MSFYRQMFNDLRQVRELIWTAMVLFAVGIVLGAVLPVLSQPALQQFQEIAGGLLALSTGELMLAIFLRNLLAAGFAILAGIAFGLVPAAAAVTNGLIFGAIFALAPTEVWRVLPHGIFELPAMFIAWGSGLWLGLWFAGPDRLARLRQRLAGALRIFLGGVVPLLVVASLIEGASIAWLLRQH